LRDGKVMVVEALKLEAPRTKELLKVIEDLGIQGSALIVDEPIGRDLVLSARNLKQVKTTLSTAINIMDVLKYDTIVFTEAAAGRVSEVLTP
ncbi:MAG: 50S ribosomal protein L4, partial [Acidobacteriota bacterium]